MVRENRPAQPPRQLSIGSGDAAASFVLAPEHVALHGIDAATDLDGAAPAFTAEGVAVVARSAPREPRGDSVRTGPVYVNASGTSFAVPTGRVFLRLAAGGDVSAQRDAIANAGFAIAEVPEYAPHAAWLEPTAGDIAAALAALPALKRIAGVESVEPELLQRRAQR
jgi:hypothetical protein